MLADNTLDELLEMSTEKIEAPWAATATMTPDVTCSTVQRMTTMSMEPAEAASRTVLEAIKDPAVRAGAIAFIDELQSAVSDVLCAAEKIKDDPCAMAALLKEFELGRS